MTALPHKCYATRALALVAVVLSAVKFGIGVGIAQAADARLDLADAALEKAYVLVDESEAGVVDEKSQKTFDKATAKPLEHIAAARRRSKPRRTLSTSRKGGCEPARAP